MQLQAEARAEEFKSKHQMFLVFELRYLYLSKI